MDAPAPDFLIVGTIRKPHGIKGELMVNLDTDHPAAVFRPGRVLALGTGEGRPEGRTLTLERARPFKDGMLVKVAEHTGRTEALEELRGHTLLIPAAEAAPPADDEVFYHEVVGMRVVVEGEVRGRVRDLYEIPSGTLLSVDVDGREVLVPFAAGLVRRIDREARELEVEAPRGLFEL